MEVCSKQSAMDIISTIYFKLADIARDNQTENSKYGQNVAKK